MLTNKDSIELILQKLKNGNDRYVKEQLKHFKATSPQREALARDGQNPFVSILTCSDSRVPVEQIFDQPLGSLFVIRCAGNTVFQEGLATLEYSFNSHENNLILVLGHTHCGAITAAMQNHQSSQLPTHLDRLIFSIRRGIENKDSLNEAIWKNVERSKAEILDQSDLLKQGFENGHLNVVGAVYDIETGKVHFD